VPDCLTVLADATVLADTTGLPYDVAAGGFAAWDLRVQAPPDMPPGRWYLTAMIDGEPGPGLEDAVSVVVTDQPEHADLVESVLAAALADAAEAELTSLTEHLALPPGGHGELAVRLANNTRSDLRGQAQLISAHGSWAAVREWTADFSVPPGDQRTFAFPVTIPASARPGQRWWALVKVMYFGHLRYSQPVWIEVTD
jgi:hypothetical protein